MNEEEIIEENANYVLGMYDLYHNDKVIVDMLKMKGLSDAVVEKILVRIKKPAWQKRVKQAKRMIMIAVLVLLILVIIPYIIVVASGAPPGILLAPRRYIRPINESESMLFFYFRWILSLAHYIIILMAVQLFIGFHNLLKYKKLLRTV
jgi:hypothetical protein